MKKMTVLIIMIFCFYNLLSQETRLPPFVTDSLETYITRGMTKWQIPGLSIAIIKDGTVAFMKGYGVTQLGGNEAVDENTIFMIGSNTKLFTATAITMLQEEGALSLDDKVQKWIPEFKLKDSIASKMINIADLLSHRIGFESVQGDFTYFFSDLSREEVIQKMALINAPYDIRTNFGYCNAAYVVAGELIPRITDKNWEETIRSKILLPLEMNRTFMLTEELENIDNIASPHDYVNGKLSFFEGKLSEIPFINLNNLAPAGSMWSSISDMATWITAQLSYGKFNGNQVIAKGAIIKTRSAYTILGLDQRTKQDTHFYLEGLGLFITDRNGRVVYIGGGGVPGFLSSLIIIPEEDLGIVIFTNSFQNNFYDDLANEICDAFLELPYQGYSDKSFETFLQDSIESKTRIDSLNNLVKLNNIPGYPLETYTGTYQNQLYGDIEIKMEKDKLIILFSHHPDLVGVLEYIQNETFLCNFSYPILIPEEVPFKVVNGEVKGLTLDLKYCEEFTNYVFLRKNE